MTKYHLLLKGLVAITYGKSCCKSRPKSERVKPTQGEALKGPGEIHDSRTERRGEEQRA